MSRTVCFYFHYNGYLTFFKTSCCVLTELSITIQKTGKRHCKWNQISNENRKKVFRLSWLADRQFEIMDEKCFFYFLLKRSSKWACAHTHYNYIYLAHLNFPPRKECERDPVSISMRMELVIVFWHACLSHFYYFRTAKKNIYKKKTTTSRIRCKITDICICGWSYSHEIRHRLD